MSFYSQILGTGSGFPKRVMTNAEFETFVDTNDEWIRTRTGIETRRIANREKGETTLTLVEEAARSAMKMAGVTGSEIDLIVIGTLTADTVMPNVGNLLQALLGSKNAFSFDLSAACSGFMYGLGIADSLIKSGMVKTALVAGGETLSTYVNWKDRGTCVLFGDGAGAAIVRRTEDPSHSILGVKLCSDGTYGDLLKIPHGSSKVPPHAAEYRGDQAKIQMQGSEVFKLAVRSMCDTSTELLKEHGYKIEDVDFFIFHQANIRIIEMCMKNLAVDPSKTWLNVNKYGNTSAATLPVCLDEAWRAGAVKPGNLVLMTTFGGGLTWGSALVRL